MTKNCPTPNKINRFLKYTLVAIGLVCFVVYSVFEFHKFAMGPNIIVSQPKTGQTLKSSLININGIAENISKIKLNDKKIFVDKEGNFNERLIANSGYNIITIEAWDKFERHIKKEIEVVYKK